VGLYPATRSGIGLALLAQQDSRQLHGLFGGREIPGFPGGLPDLEAHLAQVRSQGYARVQLQPRTITLGVGVGAPPYAALAASGDFSEKQQAVLVDRLAQAARAIASPSATFQPGMQDHE
jgi:DNA-binding IclR family transcriptional regulator